MVDYNHLVTRVKDYQTAISSKIDNFAKQIVSARENVVNKIIDENNKYINTIEQGKLIKDEDKGKSITQLESSVSTAVTEVQIYGMRSQYDLRTNNMKSNTESITKVMDVTRELQTALIGVPSGMDSQ